ncbi:MAG: GIY-YIG nuclease family protein [Caldicoprobacterales bacterium]|nr:GIY-YIG nuclease family protein [Clostridiales bacterium]
MDKQRRKELREQFNQIKIYMGVYKITNTVNGKIFVGSSPNLKNRWTTIKWQLSMGMHVNSQLQEDWNELDAEAFTYEILEKKDADKALDPRWEVKQMEKVWLDKLQPYGNRGYNKRKS